MHCTLFTTWFARARYVIRVTCEPVAGTGGDDGEAAAVAAEAAELQADLAQEAAEEEMQTRLEQELQQQQRRRPSSRLSPTTPLG